MEFHEAIRRRPMVRSFAPDPVDRRWSTGSSCQALRSPTAGKPVGRPGWSWKGPSRRPRYFDATTDEAWRSEHPRVERRPAPGPGGPAGLRLRPTPTSARYAEPDKAAAGLGDGAWPVARPLLDRRRRLRGHDRSARPPSTPVSAPACSAPSGARPRSAGRARRPRGLAPVLRRGAGPPRRRGSSLALTRPAAAGARHPPPPRPVVTRDHPGHDLDNTCSGPSCQRAMAHSRSESRLR